MLSHGRLRILVAGLLCLSALITALGLGATTSGARAAGTSTFAPQCADPNYPGQRDPSNPLMLKTAPANGDVLDGAPLFVAGPARGTAAGAIAQLLGYSRGEALASGQALTGFPDSLSWASFAATVAQQLPQQSADVQRQIHLLEKIAQEPTPLRVSAFSGGGSPAAVYAQTRKLFCTVLQADPQTIPIITTYFLHAELGGCASTTAIDGDAAAFKAQINAMAQAIARRPVILFLELDAVGSSSCMAAHGSIGAWESLLRYETTTFEALPHTAVYLEGGYSDANSATYAAQVLNHSGIRQIQGFFTNDTHLQWTAHELRYARAVSRRTGGAHLHGSTMFLAVKSDVRSTRRLRASRTCATRPTAVSVFRTPPAPGSTHTSMACCGSCHRATHQGAATAGRPAEPSGPPGPNRWPPTRTSSSARATSPGPTESGRPPL